MKKILPLALTLAAAAAAAQPIALHPDNPRYFLFRGSPAVIVASGEHYGAVLNPAFDWPKYLETLSAAGLNGTRLFSGAYFEPQGAFGIAHNCLAPAPGSALTPWARSAVPGGGDGGNRFELGLWNPAYFSRLKAFVGAAERLGIVVELTLFSSVYNEENWRIHPLNPANHVPAGAPEDRFRAHTLDNGPLAAVQEAMVRKIVRELNGFDNVVYEIQNEPWSDHPDSAAVNNPYLFPFEFRDPGAFWKNRVDLASRASQEWQARIAAVIRDEEAKLPLRHLVAQNFCNFRFPLEAVDPNVSVLNFHYAWPEAVAWNRGWERPVAFDETGFAGTEDGVYRRQAWRFMLSGGAAFSQLDYSFYPGREDGTGTNRAPGGGSPELRKQLRTLREFMDRFDFVDSVPGTDFVARAPGRVAYGLAVPGREYALYLEGRGTGGLVLSLPEGTYEAEWTDPRTGDRVPAVVVSGPEGTTTPECPLPPGEAGLRLTLQR